MVRIILFLLAVAFPASVGVAQSRATNTLEIYVIDVEGGNAVLFAAPSGESVLVDTGNGGARRRPGCWTHYGRGQGRRRATDRSLDHYSLSRRPYRRTF